MDIQKRVAELGLSLYEPPKPGGNYLSVNVRGNIVYVAIQTPKKNGEFLYQGRIGLDVSEEDAYLGMQLCALNVVSQIHHHIGFEKILGMNHMDAYFQAIPSFENGPKIVDGASNLFVDVLGESGRHTRAIFGVESLPKNLSVAITCTFTLKS
ncbi:RidA family protein [Leptospira sp. 96542]|nr:RidA family protein [Leptospira sp. 96542]